MLAKTLCPFSNSTRNMALGNGSITVPSTSIASFFGTLQMFLSVLGPAPGPTAQPEPACGRADAQYTGRSLRTSTARRWGIPGRQDLVSSVRDGDRVLEVRGDGPVGRDDRPVVGQDPRLVAAHHDHGLDGDHE